MMAFFMAMVALALSLGALWYLHKMPKGDGSKSKKNNHRNRVNL